MRHVRSMKYLRRTRRALLAGGLRSRIRQEGRRHFSLVKCIRECTGTVLSPSQIATVILPSNEFHAIGTSLSRQRGPLRREKNLARNRHLLPVQTIFRSISIFAMREHEGLTLDQLIEEATPK